MAMGAASTTVLKTWDARATGQYIVDVVVTDGCSFFERAATLATRVIWSEAGDVNDPWISTGAAVPGVAVTDRCVTCHVG